MIYLIRHGQTNYNINHLVQGALIDEELNENGIREAERLRDVFDGHHFRAALVSPLIRAKQTAEIISDKAEVERIVEDSRFIERNYGILEGKPSQAPDFSFYYSADIEGAEDPNDLYKRISNALIGVAREYDGDILIVSHGGIIGSFVSHQLGNKKVKIENSSCVLVDSDTGELIDYNVSLDRLKEILD